MKSFDTLGVMIDMSRNAVMQLPALKRFLQLLRKIGYNCVMLYTEDTYEVDGEPYFGYMRGRYSKQEMKEIDSYAASLGMELIPCIQTLAHLNAIKRWGKVPFDCDDILMVDDDRTYELIDRMFSTLSECFTSRRIHIGMDEAHMLGRGQHQQKYGIEDASSIMQRHLKRVNALAQKYRYEPMIWSDMCFRPWNNGEYYIAETQLPQEYIDILPENVIPVYWDYYQTAEENYAAMLRNHKQISSKTWFAGGIHSWRGMIPSNRYSLQTMLPAIDACKKEGVRNIFFTTWGDDGAENSHFSILPALFYLAEYVKGNTDAEKIKARFRRMIGIEFDEFMLIDTPNDVTSNEGRPNNPSKYMLFSDCFNDFLDYTVKSGGGEFYRETAKRLHAVSKKSRTYGYLFRSAACLCDALEIKYELGLRTRRAYEAGDKSALQELATKDYPEAIKRIKRFADAFERQWMTDNKPHGFDVQDMRFGGLLRRLGSCQRRLLEYAQGKRSCIEELDEELLPFGEHEKSGRYNYCPLYSTVNLVHQNSWTI